MVFRQADNQIKRRGMLFDGAAKGSKGRCGVPSKAGHDERPSEKKRLYCNAVCADRISGRVLIKSFDICFPIDFHTGILCAVFYCAFSLPACPLPVYPRRRITAAKPFSPNGGQHPLNTMPTFIALMTSFTAVSSPLPKMAKPLSSWAFKA